MAPDLSTDAWAQIRYAYEHTDRPIEDICAEHRISSGTLRDRMRRWNWTRRRPPIPREGPPAVTPQAFASPPPTRAANGGEGPPAAAEAMAGLLTRPPKRSEGGSGVGGFRATRTADPLTPLRLADASRSDPPHRFAGGGMEHAAPLPPASGIEHGRSSEEENGAQLAPGAEMSTPAEGDAAQIVPRLQSAVARVLPAIEATIAKLAAGPQHPREMEQTARALGTLTRTLRELNALLSQRQAAAGPRASGYDDMPEDLDAFRQDLARRIQAFMESRSDEAFEDPPAEG